MSFFQFISEQRRALPVAVSEKICSGRVYIVTGSNTGLGLEAARHLASCRPKRVILAVRNAQAGEAAKRDIESTTGTRYIVEVWQLDLASYDSVKAFSRRASNQLDRIDAVIENAGVASNTYTTGEGNNEQTIVVNVLSTFLLAVLLYPKLQATARKYNVQPHITIVSSETGHFSVSKGEMEKMKQEPLRYLNDVKTANMSARYPTTKLLQMLAARQLASQLPVDEKGVVINYLNPGMCKTSLSRNHPLFFRVMLRVINAFIGRTAEEGSRNLVYAAGSGKSSHGCYISNCEVEDDRVPEWITNAEGQKTQLRLWDDIAQELDSIQPDCLRKIIL